MENNSSAETTRILLVEDHSSFRQAMAFVFGSEPGFTVVAQAATLAEARKLLEEEFEVAVVDLSLPDGSGVDLVRELNAGSRRGATVLVLSASLDDALFAEAVEVGASGILHKSAALEEIVDAVRRLRAGEALLSPNEVISMLRLASDRRHREREARQAIERLTPREKDLLVTLAEGLDSKQIAARFGITTETERTHMTNIMGKLQVHSRLQALVFAARHGLVKLD